MRDSLSAVLYGLVAMMAIHRYSKGDHLYGAIGIGMVAAYGLLKLIEKKK